MDWVDFILARYNYWIFILLMMVGLYTVFARGNLVKKIVGLNIFQTSVFIYYISIGKIFGGTAPIYMGDELDAAAHHGPDGGEGAEHGEEAAHGAETAHTSAEGAHSKIDNTALDAEDGLKETLHSKIDNSALDHGNDLKEALKTAPQPEGADSLHTLPDAGDKIANTLSHVDKTPPKTGLQFTPDGLTDAAGDAAHSAAVAAHGLAHGGAVEAIVYTNPLPHVLILTAIVVGVATTAVGLALAVRIREAYGTIEEDELEAADDIAEFGHQPGAPAQAAAAGGAAS